MTSNENRYSPDQYKKNSYSLVDILENTPILILIKWKCLFPNAK